MLSQRKPCTGLALTAMLVVLLATACSSTKYTTAEGYSGEVRVGRPTYDKAALAAIQRVALLSFTGKNYGSGKGEDLKPFVMNAFGEFLAVFEGQDSIMLVPPEEVVANPDYQAIQALLMPDDAVSPVEGLTYIREGVPNSAVAELSESLNADALMMVHLDFDWGFPTWNATEFKTRHHAFILVPPGDEAWKLEEIAWREILVHLPSDVKRMAGVSAEEWPEILQATAEACGSHAKWMGGSLAYYFLEDAKAAR